MHVGVGVLACTQRSIEDVLQDANNVPIWQIILSAGLVFIYSVACFINVRHPIRSHAWLVLMVMEYFQ